MKRPAAAGKGLDGVVRRGSGYDNPAITLLETGRHVSTQRRSTRHRARSPTSSGRTATPPATAWCRCPSRCPSRTTSAPRARPCSWPPRWDSTPPCSCMPRRWVRLHVLRGLRPGPPPRRPPTGRGRRARVPLLSPKEVNRAIKTRLRRKLVVVGACIGTDAHTVGIDAILNIKGFAGEKGLEYYRDQGGQPRGAGPRARARRPGPWRRRPTR